MEDPTRVHCEHCGAQSTQALAAVTDLAAKCPECGGRLIDAGRRVRQHLDETRRYVIVCEIVMVLEDIHGLHLPDAGLDLVRTFGDLGRYVAEHIAPPAGTDRAAHGVALLEGALADIYPELAAWSLDDDLLSAPERAGRWLMSGKREPRAKAP
jgi:hypothetical protein